jgi:hypothetical protein
MNPFCTFMASVWGRWVRIIAGIALIAVGFALGGVFGVVIGLIGVVPLAAGLFDFCVFAPLFGCPMSGPKIRAGS